MKPATRIIFVAALLVGGGCTQAPLNAPLQQFDPGYGYRHANAGRVQEPGELALILTFSGGGTRAAALAYGVLKELRETPMPDGIGRLLDEVDVISSVSGGSFTAAYYGLFGERLFEDFDERFLRFPVQGTLAWRVFWPKNMYRVLSQTYGRTDMAAEYYDEWFFEGKTFADLRAVAGPFIVINATDMTLGAPFAFTQEQFDLLYSDLCLYPISRAVAASSAFPVALAPVTLRNYERGDDFNEPAWIGESLQERDRDWRRFRQGRQARSYASQDERPFVHVIDGGVADNLGLRAVVQSLDSTDGEWSLRRLIREGRVDRVAVIIVNAQLAPEREWDLEQAGPNEVEVGQATIKGLMDNYTYETSAALQDSIREIRMESQIPGLPAEEGDSSSAGPVEFYAIDVSFDRVKDAALRRRLSDLPTALELPGEDVDALIAAAGMLLRESPEFQRLLHDLGTAP